MKIKNIASNKKARYDYFVIEKFECGIQLVGTEVKSIRQGSVNLKDSFCSIDDKKDELFLYAMHISPYEKGNIFNKDPLRVRKLLMHKKQILQLKEQVSKQSITIIPLNIYLKGDLIKLSIGLCKGKKLYDKRRDEAKKDAELTIRRHLKERNYK